jgi:hypothetical protein
MSRCNNVVSTRANTSLFRAQHDFADTFAFFQSESVPWFTTPNHARQLQASAQNKLALQFPPNVNYNYCIIPIIPTWSVY